MRPIYWSDINIEEVLVTSLQNKASYISKIINLSICKQKISMYEKNNTINNCNIKLYGVFRTFLDELHTSTIRKYVILGHKMHERKYINIVYQL